MTSFKEDFFQNQVIYSYQTPSGQKVEVLKKSFLSSRKRPTKKVAFVSGLHGNELEGVYICSLLARHLKKIQSSQPEAFLGEVHIYPTVNPQATANGTRLWPFLSVDLNRQFGISEENSLASRCAEELVTNLKSSADLVVDFHASNLHLKETPQIRITEGFHKKLIPLGVHCNLDLIWVHPPSNMFMSTLGYNLNKSKVPTLVIESGIALRINKNFSNRVFLGIVNFLYQTGVVVANNPPSPIAHTKIVHSSQVISIHSNHAGLFVAHTDIKKNIKKGDVIGEVVDAANGSTLQEVIAVESGFLFTLREHPLVYPSALLGRIARNTIT